jgi:hypothetical protein
VHQRNLVPRLETLQCIRELCSFALDFGDELFEHALAERREHARFEAPRKTFYACDADLSECRTRAIERSHTHVLQRIDHRKRAPSIEVVVSQHADDRDRNVREFMRQKVGLRWLSMVGQVSRE